MAQAGALDLLFNLGADEIAIAPGAFVVYVGTPAIAGRIAPTSSCPAPPIPRRPAFT